MVGRAELMESLREKRAAIAKKREDRIHDARLLRGRAKRRAKMARDRTGALIGKIDAQMDRIMEEERLETQAEAMSRMTQEQTEEFRRRVAQMQVAVQGTVSSTAASPLGGGTDEVSSQGVLTVQPGELIARPLSFDERVARAEATEREGSSRLAEVHPIEGTGGMVRVGSQEMSPELAEAHRIDMGFSRLCELRFGREAFPIEVSVKVPWERPFSTPFGVVFPLLVGCSHFMLSAKHYVLSDFFPGFGFAIATSAFVSLLLAMIPFVVYGFVRRRKQKVDIRILGQERAGPFIATVVSGGCTSLIGYAELKKRSPGMSSGSLLDAIQRVLDERNAKEHEAERERQKALDRENKEKRSAHDDVEGQLELEAERARYRATGVEGLALLEAELAAEEAALEDALQDIRSKADEDREDRADIDKKRAAQAARERA